MVACALVAAGGCLSAARGEGLGPAGRLDLRTGVVDTGRLANLLAVGKAQAPDARAVVLMLDGPLDKVRRAALENAGARVLGYIPTNALIADLSVVAPGKVRALGFVTSVHAYEDSWRVDPALLRPTRVEDWRTEEFRGAAARGVHAARVWLFAGVDPAPTAAWLAARPGAQVVGITRVGDRAVVNVLISPQAAAALRSRREVQYAEPMTEVEDRSNAKTRWVVQSNITSSEPLYAQGLTGVGQIVGVIDSTPTYTHCSFNDPVNPIGPLHRKILAYNAPFGNITHGTHVSCTVVGDDGTTGNGRGVAYGAKMVYNTKPTISESDLYGRLDLHRQQGARVHNNSWGTSTTAYDGLSRAIDAFSYAYEDNVVIFAVSNGSVVTNPENAKNCLGVAATDNAPLQNNFYLGGAAPTTDGRRKPEVVAPGQSVISAQGGTVCEFSFLGGTSMAAPAVSGVATLMRQYFMEGFYPSGAANPSDGFTPSGALLRSMLVNSAVDITGDPGYPGPREGWGRILADNAMAFSGESRRLIVRDVRNADTHALSTGQSSTLLFDVGSGTYPLKAVMAFTDPPAEVNAAFAPINDVNLALVSPSGQTFTGNWFVGGVSAPEGSADPLNTVEVVLIPNPEPGRWVASVAGAAVNIGAQGYALSVSGDVLAVQCNDLDFNNDGVWPDITDVWDFLTVFSGGECPAADCDPVDFNNDGVYPDLSDVDAMLRAFSGESC